jgi:nitrogen fixation/metabolism regulation signal transduction histidine kinase
MDFRKHHILVAGMVLLLVSIAVLLGWALSLSRIHLAILLGICIIMVSAFLYIQQTRLNREILFFFRALENEETSIKYGSSHRSGVIDELHQHLNRVNETYQQLRLNDEIREQYFSRILEHLSSGLIIISGTGHINQVNEEALRLLKLKKLTHLKALKQLYPGLHYKIEEMKSLDRSELTLQDRETGLKKILGLQMVEINLGGEDVKVLTMHDLSAGMERKEIDDWIRLILVMSHEIMNSLAPITSISNTLREVWNEHITEADGRIPVEVLEKKTLKGLDAIAEQSEGLTTFFESYRVLARIPDPVKKDLAVCNIFEKLETLVEHYRENSRLRILFECEHPDLIISVDEQMITQVLLNLIKNAVQAVEKVEMGEIIVSALSNENRILLKVSDNGEGIPAEISDEIFMPFFTTRKKGTGVGLSYSRQVMAMNDGRIEFDSQPGRTQFRLVF